MEPGPNELGYGCVNAFSALSALNLCQSGATFIDDTEIDEVIFGTISNNTAGICATYSNFLGMSTVLSEGSSVPISVTLGTCGGDFSKEGAVYIDWNSDGEF